MEKRPKLTWGSLYTEVELYKSAVRLYTKPLFNPAKARSTSSDEKTLFDFAKRGLQNLHHIHRALSARTFSFRPGRAHHRNFNGKQRTLYIYPWEERLVSLLLYRTLNRKPRHTASSNGCRCFLHLNEEAGNFQAFEEVPQILGIFQ